MSNHDGSYMLNDVLKILNEEKFFEKRSREDNINFVKKIIRIGYKSDCNVGEILKEIGDKLGIFYDDVC